MKILRTTEIEIPARGCIVRDKYRNWIHGWLQSLTPVRDYLQASGKIWAEEVREGVRKVFEQLLNSNYVIFYINWLKPPMCSV